MLSLCDSRSAFLIIIRIKNINIEGLICVQYNISRRDFKFIAKKSKFAIKVTLHA